MLPGFIANTLALVALVGVGVAFGGTLTAWLVTNRRFPGARFFEWALLLPLAMPSYVMAYAYTSWLDYRRARAERAAADLRLVEVRLLVSGCAFARRRRGDVRRGACIRTSICSRARRSSNVPRR